MTSKKNTKLMTIKSRKSQNQITYNENVGQIIWHDLKKVPHILALYFSNILSSIRRVVTSIPTKIKALPQWIKNIPNTLRTKMIERRKQKKYRSFRLQKKIKPEPRYIPSARLLLWQSLKFIIKNFKLFAVIAVVHMVVYFVLIKTPQTSLSVNEIRDTISEVLGKGSEDSWKGTFTTLGTVLGLSSATQGGGTQATIAMLLVSLVYIWAIRQLSNKQKINARDAYYQGLAPIFPFLMVLVVATVQIIPFAIAGLIYSIARTGGLFVTGLEDMAFFTIALLFGLLSLFLVTPTIIALYIVTLPGMYPMHALKSAKKIVQFQRLIVFRRIIALPLLLGTFYILALLFTIRLVPSVTLYFVEILQFIFLPIVHTYLYKLYRALI